MQNKSQECVINEELLKIVERLNINKLSLNKSKCKYVTFPMPNKTTQTLILKIDNNIDIEKVEEFYFLGLKHVLPLEIKIILYNALILPHINYLVLYYDMGKSRKQISENKKERSTNYDIKQIQFTHRTTFLKTQHTKSRRLTKITRTLIFLQI